MFGIFLILIVALVVFLYMRARYISKSPWQHFFDGFAFSAEEFYGKVKAGIEDRKIPFVDFGRESFFESHIFSSKREYLKISRGEYVFYVCAAPFGTGTFVSQWLCIKKEGLLNRIPILNKLAGKDRNDKTFYQMDTEAMYRSAIHAAVLDVLDKLTGANGVHGLSELEKQYSK